LLLRGLIVGTLVAGSAAQAQETTTMPDMTPRLEPPVISLPNLSAPRPIWIFFPPLPPPLGSPQPGPLIRRAGPEAPRELAEYVNEIFYPQLSGRLESQTMTNRLRSQLEKYRAKKLALQNQLRQEIERHRSSDPETRS